MNTVGKILVIVVLLFSLVIGGFLVIDFATRTNWKSYSDSLNRELEVARVNNGILLKGNITLNQKEKETRTKMEQESAKLDIERKLLERDKEVMKDILEAEKDNAKKSDLLAQATIGELSTVKEEVKLLQGTIKKREQAILDMEDTGKKYRNEAVSNENKYLSTLSRNEFLVNRIQELERAMAGMKAGPVTVTPKDPNAPNPPLNYVKGRIERIDAKDRKLVEISVGSDQGVNANNTLEVYRLNPKAEWLGIIKIVDAHPRMAVGKLIRANNTQTPLQEGDIVASSLNNP